MYMRIANNNKKQANVLPTNTASQGLPSGPSGLQDPNIALQKAQSRVDQVAKVTADVVKAETVDEEEEENHPKPVIQNVFKKI